MAIHAYTGLPGSGKSYGVFQNVIVPALKKGKVVWTNIPFNEEKVAALCGNVPVFFKVDDIRNDDHWFQNTLPKGAVVVLDEIWRLWPSGLKTHQIKETHKSFLAEHRHMVGEDGYSTEIYLVSQDLAQVAAFARNLVDTTVRASKMTAIGQPSRFKVEIYDGPVTGPKPSKDKKIRQTIGKYEPEIYSLYQSHTMSETGEAGDETVTDDRKNIFKGTAFKLFVAAVVILPIGVIWGILKVKAGYSTEADNKAKSAPAPAASPISAAPVQTKHEKEWLEKVHIEIASNFTDGGVTHFRFRIRDHDQSAIIPAETILAMGYTYVAYDQCMVLLVKDQVKIYVMCTDDSRNQKQGLNLVDSVTDSAKGVATSL